MNVRETSATPYGELNPRMMPMRTAFDRLKAASEADRTPSYAKRLDRLRRLMALTEQHQDRIAEAISIDFGHRSTHETQISEIFATMASIGQNMRHLRGWMKSRRVPTPVHMLPGRSRLLRQPLGVVGIIAPWNYPFQLAFTPAAAALAAGNTVLLKPSDLTPRFSALLLELVAQYFSADEMVVVTGDVEIGAAFSALPFDHLFFTGSTAVGRAVATAAAHNLTPVTLELGGKSPAIVGEDCRFAEAAPRIAYGKFLNAGQTCVAPDYVLVPRCRVAEFTTAMQQAVSLLYPSVAVNPDYTSIITPRHYERLLRLLADAEGKGATLISLTKQDGAGVCGRKLTPVLVVDATPAMGLMQEEIFGPVLPVIAYDTLDEALAYINRGDRPLALYWFGRSGAERDRVLAETISGGVTINDVVWHVTQENLPFGGVGASGMGSYHGEHGFRTFSKEKPVFIQARWNSFGIFRPPYGRRVERLLAVLKSLL
ncbi:coniferyl aldehyde dehydrogenase [Duganella sp. PWIR1]